MTTTIPRMPTVVLVLMFLCAGQSHGSQSEKENSSQTIKLETNPVEIDQPDLLKESPKTITDQKHIAPKAVTFTGGQEMPKKDDVGKSNILTPNEIFNAATDKSPLEIAPSNPIDPRPRLKALNIIEFATRLLLIVSGIYLVFLGFRVYRLLIIIMGFYACHYSMLIAMAIARIYQGTLVSHQLGVFTASILLGCLMAILTYVFEKSNFIIFGVGVSSTICLLYAQFFVDFAQLQDRIILVCIYFVIGLFFALSSFKYMDHLVIIGSSIAGAITTSINVGILFSNLSAFEDRQMLSPDHWNDLRVYSLICGMIFLTGLAAQYMLRRKILNEIDEENLEHIRKTSFLN
jgi:hypothetical protein